MFKVLSFLMVVFLFACDNSSVTGSSTVDTVTILDTVLVDLNANEPVRFVNFLVCKVKCYDNDEDTLLWEYNLDYAYKPEYADTMNMPTVENIRLETDMPMYDRVQVVSPVLWGRDYQLSQSGMWSLIRE